MIIKIKLWNIYKARFRIFPGLVRNRQNNSRGLEQRFEVRPRKWVFKNKITNPWRSWRSNKLNNTTMQFAWPKLSNTVHTVHKFSSCLHSTVHCSECKIVSNMPVRQGLWRQAPQGLLNLAPQGLWDLRAVSYIKFPQIYAHERGGG